MKIVIESSADHISQLSFPQQYLKNFKVLRFIPEPYYNVTSKDDVIYSFLPSQNHIVSIYLTPTNHGEIEGILKVNGVNSFSLHHFIYP
jgi:hypothetical protein